MRSYGKELLLFTAEETKENVMHLKSYIEEHRNKWCLTHIDAVPDNFLFCNEGVQLTDWDRIRILM